VRDLSKGKNIDQYIVEGGWLRLKYWVHHLTYYHGIISFVKFKLSQGMTLIIIILCIRVVVLHGCLLKQRRKINYCMSKLKQQVALLI
jgi:hypothetical protein